MLKSFSELRRVDVAPYIKKKDGADYIPWATVVDLLHEHGAEKVYFENLYNDDGSSLLYISLFSSLCPYISIPDSLPA